MGSYGMVRSAWETCFRRKVLELGIEERDMFWQADKAVVGAGRVWGGVWV